MKFDNLLSRLDEELIQLLVGEVPLRLLRLVDSGLMTRSRLLELVLQLHTPSSLLFDRNYRNLLIDLLSKEEAVNLATVMGVLQNNVDPFLSLKEIRIRKGSLQEQALFDFFGVRIPNAEPTPEIPSVETQATKYGLFPHQRRAVKCLHEILNDYPHRAVLHMPTGAGKTRTAMHLIADHLRKTEPTVVVWLAYSEELCIQATEEFERAWQHLGNRDIHIYRSWGNIDLNIDQVNDGFFVAGLSKLFSTFKKDTHFATELGKRCSMVILDEAHSAIADTYSLMLDVLSVQKRDTITLGLTATPGRTWDNIEKDEELARFFHRKKVSLEVEGFSNPVDYLVNEGYLAKTDFQPLSYGTPGDLSQSDLARIKEALDIPYDILEKLAEDEQRNLLIVMNIEKLVNNHKRIIVFAATVDHSYLLAAVLNLRGHKASTITSRTPPGERKHIINTYRTSTEDVQILCNYGVLTAGFDAPQTSAALIARPTKSLVLYSQMVGRAIRGPKAGGNERAEIVTVIDDRLPGFGSVADAFVNWEDVWA